MDNRTFRTRLDSGSELYLRPIRPHDKARLSAAIDQMSDESRYLRFFSGMKSVPPPVLERLSNVDGHQHIAWGALDLSVPDYPVIGAVHATRTPDAIEAELAMAVLDDYHGQGLARLLLSAVAFDCLEQGILSLTADTLSENTKAKTLFRALGGLSASASGPVITYRFDTETMHRKLMTTLSTPAVKQLHAALTSQKTAIRAG